MSGDIRVNGYPKEQKTFARVTGYVEQSDIHSPQARMHPLLQPNLSGNFADRLPQVPHVELVLVLLRQACKVPMAMLSRCACCLLRQRWRRRSGSLRGCASRATSATRACGRSSTRYSFCPMQLCMPLEW